MKLDVCWHAKRLYERTMPLAGRFSAIFEPTNTFDFHIIAILAELGAKHHSAVFEGCLKFLLRLFGKVEVSFL